MESSQAMVGGRSPEQDLLRGNSDFVIGHSWQTLIHRKTEKTAGILSKLPNYLQFILTKLLEGLLEKTP